MENPYEGRLNEQALIEKRNEYLDKAIEDVFSDKDLLENIAKGCEDGGKYHSEGMDFATALAGKVMSKLMDAHDVNAGQQVNFEKSSDKAIEEMYKEYPEELVIEKVKEKMTEKFPEGIKKSIF